MVNGIVCWLSLSDLSLLMYKNAYFCILILYPKTWPNSLMSYSIDSFLVASLGFSVYSIMSSANSDSLLLIFQFGFLLFLFLFWLPWLGLPKSCWIKVLRVDILVLLLNLEEMLSVFHHWKCFLWIYCIWPLIILR